MIRGLLVAVLVLAACDEGRTSLQSTATAVSSPSAVATPTESPTAAPTATSEPTPTPTPEAEVVAPDIVGFLQHGSSLSVRLHNPNEGHGLIRSPFELTILDESGGIIAVEGSSGLPGASCCTIYQLPPGGDYGLNVFMRPDTPAIGSLELTIPGDPWVEWSAVEPPMTTVEGATLQAQFSLTVTGRVSVDQPGPFNVRVFGFADTAAGQIVIADVVECVTAGTPRAFEVSAFNTEPIDATLAEVIAYTTTVPGHSDGFTPQC